jgi:glutathione synthase
MTDEQKATKDNGSTEAKSPRKKAPIEIIEKIKIGFFVNDIYSEQAGYTTTRLAMAAKNRMHDVWIMGAGDFSYDTDEKIYAKAHCITRKYSQSEKFIADLKRRNSVVERISVSNLDVLVLRNDPSTDTGLRSWAQSSGINFGRLAMRQGVIVLNDPNGLAKAMNKMYFQTFPETIRPRTLITRDRDAIKKFAKEEGGRIVLKPLQGSGGQGVFLVEPNSMSNLNQMIDAVSRDGYVIAQEYLAEAQKGDMRLFVINGQAYKYKGKYCAFRRVRAGEDMRSNIHAGGKLRRAEVDDKILNIVEIVRPKLVQDGMFLVGLDIVGDKLMEINVFSPGGLGSAQKFEKVNFAHGIIKSLERKVQYMKCYNRNFDNADIAVL